MFATTPDQKPRRVDRKDCAHCGGSAAGCRSVEWLAGRRCCEACPGDHDQEGAGR
ncbi:hypothetical protein [Nocardioides immobilis]|uniref:hypothetical protein n=1 Tax=Nocardioides immobilis TaxID=2049295 RepID=UPI0015F878A0|nr:hypothetical protein [Nocardioides immobilis]